MQAKKPKELNIRRDKGFDCMTTILIVEDNELNRKLFRDLLLTQHYRVVDIAQGEIACKTALECKPDLILMDIQLQGVSGFDVIYEMKAHDELKDIPIIAVTAFAMKDDEARILASGCDAYIAKPISIDPFLAKIKSLLKVKNRVRLEGVE